MKNLKLWMVLPLMMALVACKGNAEKDASSASAAKPIALTVQTHLPETMSWENSIPVQGNIMPWQEAIIAAETGGLKLKAVYAEVGSMIKKGQVLAEFDTASIQTSLKQQQAAYQQAKVGLRQASADAARARSLKDTGAMSDQQIAQFQYAEEAAQAAVVAAQTRIDADQLRLQQSKIIAPDAGLISVRLANLGAVVQPGAELFRIIRDGRLEWRAEIAEQHLPELFTGQTAYVSSTGGEPIAGKIRLIAPTLDAARNVIAYVSLPSANLKSGMFVKGEIKLGMQSALTIPLDALILRDGRSFAFVVDAKNTARRVPITTGRQMQNRVEVKQGLQASDKVIIMGAAFLNDGDVVRIAPEQTAKAQ